MDEQADLRLLLSDLKGQIDVLSGRVEHVHVTLSQKVDQTHSVLVGKVTDSALLVEERLNSTHREMSQLLQFHGEGIMRQQKQMDSLEARFERFMAETDSRLVNIAQEAAAAQQRHDDLDDDRFAELFAFRTQVKTIIALIVFMQPLVIGLLLHYLNR